MTDASAARAMPESASRYLEDPIEIQRALRVFREQQVRVSLRFESSAESYTARLLDVTGEAVRLDDIKPRSGLSLMHQGEAFSLTGRSEGVFVYAEGLHAAVAESERGLPYFSVALPRQLLHQQRRRSTRFRLPLRLTSRGAQVRLHRNGRAIEGSIQDISTGGCRATFQTALGPVAPDRACAERCEVRIANLLSIEAQVAIRHTTIDQASGTVRCGIEFVAMEPADRQRLDSFIQTIARLSAPT